MKEATPRTIFLKDYRPPDFLIDQTVLRFELGDDATIVSSRLHIRRAAGATPHAPLVLDGEELELLSLRLNDWLLPANDWFSDAESLTLPGVPDVFVLEVETRIRPQENTRLEGLYQSSGTFCTQCEAEGFRRITYYLDRPDVMSVFTTTVIADAARYPTLLSNGNPVETGTLDGGRHFVTWHDPHPKPCYLFALVAGDLACHGESYSTSSGRKVDLRIYVEPHNADKCEHAMASLKKAMKWDEARFGLEYDLDIYMIVAVDDFNMGAMENKGLNIFNSKYVLARPDTATDADYEHIEGVIAHEYFHNWTGNRVTCRDWFQLSLKEGLTVFRDQSFTADMTSGPVKRIDDVRMLRNHQFAEDASPMAHPIRPAAYMEINNFYTVTVYEKGAEVVRMYETLLGREGFRHGMDLYFKRHDGQAVTTEDFLAAMADANDAQIDQFRRWYDQAGTPEVSIEDYWDADNGCYTLRLRQSCPPTPGQVKKLPFLIPFKLGLVGPDGSDLPLHLKGESGKVIEKECVLWLSEADHVLQFTGLKVQPVPSLNREFSAPVRVNYPYTPSQLVFLAGHDSDAFNRWDAGERYAIEVLQALVEEVLAGRPLTLPPSFVDMVTTTVSDESLSPGLRAEMLSLPGESWLAEQMDVVYPDAVHQAREHVRRDLALMLEIQWLEIYHTLASRREFRYAPEDASRRRLCNLALGYLVTLDTVDVRQLAYTQFVRADNMTDMLGALSALMQTEGEERLQALDAFYARWQDDPLVLDKWFSLQAMRQHPETLAQVRTLMSDRAFSLRNPNRVRALIGAFAHGNPTSFHAVDGAGYRFVSEQVLALDTLNPQVAARLAKVFSRWRRYDPARQTLMHAELERLAAAECSRDVFEIVSKSLATDT